jgi:hypothetical protein
MMNRKTRTPVVALSLVVVLHVPTGTAMSTRNPSGDRASEFLVIMVHKSGAPVSVTQ